MDVVHHLEAHLGEIVEGWSDRKTSGTLTVVRFADRPFDGVTTYSTVGMSNSLLPFDTAREKRIRQELIFAAYDRYDNEQIASFLFTLAEFLLTTKGACCAGDVIGPYSPIVMGSALDSIYATIPVVYDEGFAVLETTIPPTVFVWIVPIYQSEATIVRTNGWLEFETQLESQDLDLWDLSRMAL
ncbi:MAG: suppressor of fused domain protein [Acidobacteria bacterium]|nr:suppressor of fused domain protein [Acidobacteriota bacterium]